MHRFNLQRNTVIRSPLGLGLFLHAGMALADPSCPSPPGFNVPRFLPIDAYVRAVNGGDLNRDGHIDLVTSNGERNDMSIFLGAGDGSFELASTIVVGTWPAALEISDFNSDRQLDLAVAHRLSAEVSVLLGKGDGSFEEPRRSPVGEEPESIVLGDFNVDGMPDLATLNVGSNDISVLLSKGDGTFLPESRLIVDSQLGSLMATDLNHDGALDFAATLFRNDQVRIWPGKGDGSFGVPLDVFAPARPIFVAGADLDGDANPDLITASGEDEGLSVLLGKGDFSFQPVLHFAGLPEQVALAAFNASSDVVPDILVLTISNVSVLEGKGDGALGPPGPSFISGDAGGSAFFLADLDEDGLPDLARPNGGSWKGVSILFGRDGGSFEAPVSFSTGGNGPGGPTSVLSVDLNGDGLSDVITPVSQDDEILVLHSNGDGTLREKQRIAPRNGPRFVHAADIDGDGILDLAVAKGRSASREISVLPGLSDGSFGEERSYPAGLSSLMLVVTDFDVDGRLDIAAADLEKGAVIILPGEDGGTFGPPREIPIPTVISLATGDLDRDGHIDVVAGKDGGPAILFGKGDGTFQLDETLQSLNSSTVIVVDLNGDSMLDIATASWLGELRRFDAAGIFLGNGDGTFAMETRFPAGVIPNSIASGDLDRDGDTDLLVASHDSRSVCVLTGNGDGSFNAAVEFPGGGEWAQATTGDVNGDADLDIVVVSERSRNVSVLLNVPVPCGPPFLRGDANGDATLDISDPIRILGFLYLDAPQLSCADSGDANDDGLLDASDAVFLLSYLYLGTVSLPAPGRHCGPDPTEDSHNCAESSSCSTDGKMR